MKAYFSALFSLTLLILVSSCRKDFDTVASSGRLEFSKDTVYLDTIFTNTGSATYQLKVYNRSKQDIYIPTVRLEKGSASKFRLNVDGIPGKEFENVEIPAKDSIFIFIETTVDIQDFNPSDNEYLYTDVLEFDTGSNLQKVQLVTLVKDAVFLYPGIAEGIRETLLLGADEDGNEIRIEGFYLEADELHFTNEKPYVVYGYAAVGDGTSMQVDAGARLYFHANSGIIVGAGGSLKINGLLSKDQDLLENEVIFEGDRLENDFSDIPGQWGTVWLTDGSIANEISHLTIRNATIGILVDHNDGSGTPTLSIKNSQIYNSSAIGLLARTANIDAENLVIGNAGQASLYCSYGGSYNFKHCTFANYWEKSFRNYPAVLLDNYIEAENGQVYAEDLDTQFSNCIIYGSNNLELLLDRSDNAAFQYLFRNCLIKLEDVNNELKGNPLYDFQNATAYENIILNNDPLFRDQRKEDLRISDESPANDTANLNTAQLVPADILGVNRTINPDIGAYQSIPF